MGFVSPPAPFRPNLDRWGLPKDYATYVWLLYRRVVADDSPARRAFLNRGRPGMRVGELLLQASRDTR